MFSPTDEPGPSFTDVLRRVGLDPFAPISGGIGAEKTVPFDIRHGTTIVALRYADGVVMAGDRRATAGSSIAHRAMDKVHPADRHSGVAIAGAAGPAMEMVRLFQLQLEHYEKVEGAAISLEGKANQLSAMVRANLGMAMQGFVVVPLFAGLRRAARRGPDLLLRRHRRALRGNRLSRRRIRWPGRPDHCKARMAPRSQPDRGGGVGGQISMASGR